MRLLKTLLILIAVCSATMLFAQRRYRGIDKLFDSSPRRFIGVVLIAEGDKITYSRTQGDAYVDRRGKLPLDSRFIIGSVSKQFTAVLALRAYEKGLLQLHVPIGKYLPDLPAWRDSVTVYHLLTHLHGINEDDISKPLAFVSGSRFEYSQVGYDLIARVLEKVTGKSFEALSDELFAGCGMNNTGHPGTKYAPVQGYHGKDGRATPVANPSYIPPVAAGNFVSTAKDLLRWNNLLHGGKLLHDSTYKIMITPQPNAIRQHPLFGRTLYGLGITVTDTNGLLQLGQTGLRAGYNSMNFYFPGTMTSVIVLSNVQYDDGDLKKTMKFHTDVLEIVKKVLKGSKKEAGQSPAGHSN